MPDFSDSTIKSMACYQYSQLWRKLRTQIDNNVGGIKQHPHFKEIHTEIRLPAARSSNVPKLRPKKVVPKDQNTGEAKAVARQVKELKTELDALKALNLVEKGASTANQQKAWAVNMSLIAMQMMKTVNTKLFSKADKLTSVDDINDLYNLQYIGMVAMDIAQKVCSRDWVKLTFPDLPEADYLKVKMYDLSAEIKKCLTKKCVKDVKKADLKTWFLELVNQDVSITMPTWPNVITPRQPRHQLRDGLTPGWGIPSASPNPFDMATSHSIGMGTSPIPGLSRVDGANDRHSFTLG